MFKMRLNTAWVFIAVVVSPLLLEGFKTCRMRNSIEHVDGCPVKLIPDLPETSGGFYSECVTIRAWFKADDFDKTQMIEILSPSKEIIRPTLSKERTKWNTGRNPAKKTKVWCQKQMPYNNQSLSLWELVYNCIKAKAQKNIVVSYKTSSKSCLVNYSVPDPAPNFHLSVKPLTKSINVTVEPGDKVHIRWCYRQNAMECTGGSFSTDITNDPAQSRSALLNIPYLLPCVCVQVYYTYVDALRHLKCPFQNNNLTNTKDVWLSSEVMLFQSSLIWSSDCPAADLEISASLCWRDHTQLCTPLLDPTLEWKDDGHSLIFNTSAVDKHPRMCVQFSLRGSHNISCPFQAGELVSVLWPTDMSSWEVKTVTVKRSTLVYVTSSLPATFTVQLCVPNEAGCISIGQVYTARVEENTTETRLNVVVPSIAERPCVQVWRSDPALHGRRILCPDYSRYRHGLYTVAALVFVVVVALLGIFIHFHTKNEASDCLCIQKPVLLVCSSEQSAHISAVCALASILQCELSATVHMALFAQSSQRQAGSRIGVADLGPLPWLYGQWEAVREAQGKVLIIWSPEAKMTYEKWREDMDERKQSKAKGKHDHMREEMDEDLKINGRRLRQSKQVKTAGENKCVGKQSTVIEAVFIAALARLERGRQECKDQGVALAYFQGLCHSRDIPKAFRGVPRYCIPQDFSGLIQELGGMTRQTKTGELKTHCWLRLVSKVLSMCLARRLAHRLLILLPQTQGRTLQEVTPSKKMIPNKSRCRIKVTGTVQEQETLHSLS